MEDSLLQSPVRDLRLRQRSPLKSQTYRTLSRILSLFEFDDKNQPPRFIKFAPYQLPPGSLTLDDFHLNDAVEISDQGIYDHGETGDKEVNEKENTSEENGRAVGESLEVVGLSDRVNSETRMMLDEISDTMSIDDDDGGLASKQKENIAEGINRMIYLEDNESDRERMIFDELTTILNEDFATHRDVNSVARDSVNETPCGDAINEMENKHVEQCSFQSTVVNDFKEVALMLEDGERSSQNVSTTFCIPPGSDVLVPQRKEREEIENSLSRSEILGVEVEGPGNSLVASADNMLTPIPVVVDGQMEEGELSDAFEIDVSAEANIEISQLADEKDGKGLLPEAVIQWAGLASGSLEGISNFIDNKEEKVTEADGGNVVCGDGISNYEITKGPEVQGVGKCDNINEDRKCEIKQGAAMEVASIPTFRSNSLVFYGDILEQNEVAGEGRASVKDIDLQKKKRGLTSENDFDGQKKTKRGPVSQARKEKKKKMDRMKRAEKNRELGVKRLKLQPIVQKPKPIALCRHYIRGRCHEGEKCKFSHDTVPLTKSKPCSHFARHSCMKGDDCPFDHQLSKYSCSNFASKGYCSRGDSCLFSHKIPAKEDSTLVETNVSGPESRPPVMPSDIGAVKRPSTDNASDKAAGAVLDRLGISFKSIDQIIASLGTAQVKKPNFGSYPAKDLAVASPCESGYRILSSNQRDEDKADNHVKESSFAGSALKAHESVKNPSLVPKGINFLTFVSPLQSGYSNSSSKERDEGKLNADENVETPPLVEPKGINFQTFASPVHSGYNNSSSKGRDEGASSTSQASECVQTPPLMVPKGMNFLTFGRSLLGNTSSGLPKSENMRVDTRAEADGQAKMNGSEMVCLLRETPAKAQLSAGSQEHSNTSVPNNVSSPKQVTAPSRVIHIDDRFSEGEQMNKLQSSSEKVSNLPTFPSSSLQQAGSSTPPPYKSKSISAQKTLSSTLAFAARCEKEMMIRNHSSGDHATCSATINETSRGYEQNDSAKAIKILDFLSSIVQKKV